MSLFGSLYDEDDERGVDGDASAPPEAEPAAAPANGTAPPGAASPDEGLPEVDVPADNPDDRDGAEEAPTPTAALDIDAPSMSLQDFAAQMFDGSAGDGAADDGDPSDEPVSIEVADDLDGGFATLSTGKAGADTHDDPQPNPEPEPEIEVPALGEPASVGAPPDESSSQSSDASPDDALDDAPVEAPSGFSSLFGGDDDGTSAPDESGPAPTGPSSEASPGTAPKTGRPAGSIASAASDLADLAKSPVATLYPPDADDEIDSDSDDAPSGELDGTSTAEPADEPIDFGEPLLIDDLLPSAKPGGGTSLPSLSGRIPVKLVAVLLVAALAGFVGMRMLGGGSGGDPAAESSGSAEAAAPADGPGSETPRSPGEVLDRAQEADAEVELRNATIAAQAEYATTGTFARSAADWDAVIPEAQVEDASAPARDVVSVVSDDDAVCFETLLQNGTTVAAGVTATTMGFEQDPGGDSICTVDAAVIEGWAPNLSGL